MLGFTLPLFIILAIESTVGALLLCPKPVCNPAIALARLSYTQVGTTVFHTLAGVLLLLLASPIYDGARIYYASKEATEQTSLELREHEAHTLLSFTLTASCVALMFLVRKLGRVLGQMDRMSVSEAAMLKQVKGLQSEYTRLVDSGTGGGDGGSAKAALPVESSAAGGAGSGELPAGEVAELRRLLGEVEQQSSDLQARLSKANEAQAKAESNLSAVRTQSQGLANEYDRLLAEHDELKRQLARAGMGGGGASGGLPASDSMGKKDE